MPSTQLELIRGDITTLKVDAIVNAANAALSGGGGVDGAIHRAAGPELLEACLKLKGAKTGEVKVTPAFSLSAEYVFHAVGPVWWGGHKQEPELLASCYRHSIQLAAKFELKSIAFPSISCGVYRYPIQEAAHIAVSTVKESLLELRPDLEKVVFCAFDSQNYLALKQVLGA